MFRPHTSDERSGSSCPFLEVRGWAWQAYEDSNWDEVQLLDSANLRLTKHLLRLVWEDKCSEQIDKIV